MSNKKTNMIFHANGTVTDPSTGLMWMIPLVGQGWDGDSPVGDGIWLSWYDATERFGKGRQIDVPKYRDATWHPFWRVTDKDKPALTQDSYKGYQFGTKRYEFAGFNDWRMSTVEELFTLMEAGVSDNYWMLWAANPSDLSPDGSYRPIPGKISKLLKMDIPYETSAWHAQVDIIFGDISAKLTYGVRLVRLGYLFQAMH